MASFIHKYLILISVLCTYCRNFSAIWQKGRGNAFSSRNVQLHTSLHVQWKLWMKRLCCKSWFVQPSSPNITLYELSLWWYLKYQQQWTKTHIQDKLKLTCSFQCPISAENNCTWARMRLEDIRNVYELMKNIFGLVLYEGLTKLLRFHCDHIRLIREWKNWHNVNACWKDCALTGPTKKFFQYLKL